MPVPVPVQPDPSWPAEAVDAARRYRETAAKLTDRSFWPLLMHVNANLFLWHLEAFAKDEDPVPLFVDAMNRAVHVMETALKDGIDQHLFPADHAEAANAEDAFEGRVSGLFSDIWLGMTDDIYFDQTFSFTKERFERNGIDPFELFRDKVIVDGGCGSGKFSAALAKFGARKVIGLDIGERGLEFARAQARKVPYGDRLEYRAASLLDIPLEDASVDMVWSNGVIHHTLGYEKCVSEFARIIKPGGRLFLYVNGRFGLFELLQDSLRIADAPLPRGLFQHFLTLLGLDSGRIYWMMDCLFAPYEWKSASDVEALLKTHGLTDLFQMKRGVATDQIEQITTGLPYASIKYGEGQLKYLATKAG